MNILFYYLKEFVKQFKMKRKKEKKGGLLSMLLGTLGAGLLGNILAGKVINRAGKEIIRASYGSKESSKTKHF